MPDPLSGDISGFASSHPADPSSVESKPIKAPKGRMPAAAPTSNPPQPSAQSAEPAAPQPPADALAAPDSAGDTMFPDPAPSSDAQPVSPAGDTMFPDPAPDPLPKPGTNNDQMRSVVGTNLQAHTAAKPAPVPGQQLENGDFFHDLMGGLGAGWDRSVLGLATRNKLPDTILPEHADMAMRISSQIAQLAGDAPAMVAGMIGGAAAGGATGGVTVPVVGAIPGAAVGGTAGAFALPAAIRKMYMDHLEKGNISDSANPAREFASRLMATTWEATKGGITGAATAIAGGAAAPVAGKLASMATELATMTTVGSALEGKLPSPQDFLDGAIVIGGIHGLTHITGTPEKPVNAVDEKLKNIAANSGDEPAAVAQKVQDDVIFRQEVLTGNAQEPAQAVPTKLEHSTVTEPAAEGEPDKILGTKTDLVPKTEEDLGIRTPLRLPKEVDLSSLSQDAADKQEILSKIGEHGKGPDKTWGDSWNEFYTKSVDYLHPVAMAIKEATLRGADIGPEEDAYNKMQESKGWMDTASGIIVNGFKDKDGGYAGDSPAKIFKDAPDRNDFRAYAMAANALEEHAAGRTPWENFKPEQAQRVVDSLGGTYKELNDRLQAFDHSMIDWVVEKGRLSPEAAQAIKDSKDAYSPQARAFEADAFGGESSLSAKPLKERTGSERQLLDPFQQRYKNIENMVKSTLINEAHVAFIKNMDAGELIQREANRADPVPPILKAVEGVGQLGENQLQVFENGERKVYEGSAMTIDSLKRLQGDSTALDMTGKVLRTFTNMVRIGVVSNPGFGVAHFIRSQINAALNSQTGMIPFVHSIPYIFSDILPNSDAFKDFTSGGGAGGRYLKADVSYGETDLAKEDNTKAPVFGKVWNAINHAKDASEAFIRLTDTASKFAEHQRSLDRGAGPSEALANARMVVPDYSNVGLQRSVLRTGVAFIGAHINSLDNLKRNVERDPMGVATKIAVMSGMSAALWVVNRDDEAINALPDWQKNTYWNININRFNPDYKGPQDATIIKIPKPWAPGIMFASGTEVALNQAFGKNPRSQEVANFAHSVASSVVPGVLPNIAQPILDQYANKQGFTGRPLVPEYKTRMLPEMQYSPYTSETSKAIAKIIGYVPLVKDIGPSSDPLSSPAVVDNYIKTWGGTMGGWALQASDFAGRGFKPSTKSEPWEDTAIIRQFVSRYPSFQDQNVSDFYENRDAADKAFNSYKAASKAGNYEAAQAIAAAHPDYQVRLDHIGKAMSAARATYENIQENPNIPNVEKRQQLDTILFQIGSMAKSGNQMMSDFRRGTVQNSAKGN